MIKITTLALIFMASCASAFDPLSTHILDTTAGRPAAGVTIVLSGINANNGKWQEIAQQ